MSSMEPLDSGKESDGVADNAAQSSGEEQVGHTGAETKEDSGAEDLSLSESSLGSTQDDAKAGIRSSLSQGSKLNQVVEIAKRRGLVFQNSEIYGGLASSYDLGPLGAEMARNIRDVWIREIVHKNPNVVSIDGSIISHPRVWEASGHVEKFNDPLVQDKVTRKRYRADHLIEEKLGLDTTDMSFEEMDRIIQEKGLKSPEGNEVSEVKSFNLMVKAGLGSTDESKQEVYLRGETCQNIFIAYDQLVTSSRLSPPFGVVQIGRVFRNEVTTKQFILRTREFEQLEFEYFVHPDQASEAFDFWGERFKQVLTDKLGLQAENIRFRELTDEERAHYAVKACDIECKTSGDNWLEISPLNNRGDWDLSRHSQFSGKKLQALDPTTNERYTPYVIETSFGMARLIYCVLDQGLVDEPVPGTDNVRTVLKIHPEIAPFKAAVLPLSKKEDLRGASMDLFLALADNFAVDYDEKGSIGKRYRRHDEIGTPFCVTVDFDTLDDQCVTVRDRDSMQQERVPIAELQSYITERISG